MPHVVCFEYLHLNATVFTESPASLQCEAAAMLRTVGHDLVQLPDTRVTVIVGHGVPTDWRFTHTEPIEILRIEHADHLASALKTLPNDVTHLFPIAPECDGILTDIVRQTRLAVPSSVCVLSLTPALTQTFSDKLLTAAWCDQHCIPCIPTALCSAAGTNPSQSTPSQSTANISGTDHGYLSGTSSVIKPRFGVGCQDVRLVDVSWAQLRQTVAPTPLHGTAGVPEIVDERSESPWIVQPFVPGTSCSVGIVGGGIRRLPIVLPPVCQIVSLIDGRMSYHGGMIRWPVTMPQSVSALGRQVAKAIGPFCGYVGVDIICEDTTESAGAVIVEINPRLCTSYVGYRALCQDNLADVLLSAESRGNNTSQAGTLMPARELSWRNQHLRFAADGAIEVLSTC